MNIRIIDALAVGLAVSGPALGHETQHEISAAISRAREPSLAQRVKELEGRVDDLESRSAE
jgi:hypothetical protein